MIHFAEQPVGVFWLLFEILVLSLVNIIKLPIT
jgi:hypothetical protein